MQRERIVYDIGAHKGVDSAYYLQKGYKVVAVEANPQLCQLLRRKFCDEISRGKFILVESAINNSSNQAVPFFLTADEGESSLSAERLKDMNAGYKTIYVVTRTLKDLFDEFGSGTYCKMDIENADVDALKSLNRGDQIPEYFSVELSGLPLEKLVQKPGQALAALDEFERLGYKKFKLIDQFTLGTLTQGKFYSDQRNLTFRLRQKLESLINLPSKTFNPRLWYNNKLGYTFTTESSGAFGEDLLGEWYPATTMKKIIQDRFEEYYEIEKHKKHNIFWVDLHATW